MNNYEALLKKLNELLTQKILERNKLEEEQKEISNKLNDKDNEIENTTMYIKELESIINILENDIKFDNIRVYKNLMAVCLGIMVVLHTFFTLYGIYGMQDKLLTFLQIIPILLILSLSYGIPLFLAICNPIYYKKIREEYNLDDAKEKLERAKEKLESLNKEKELIQEEGNKRQNKIMALDEEIKNLQENIRSVESSKEMAIKMVLDDAINEGRINATFSEDLEIQKTLARLPKKSSKNKM